MNDATVALEAALEDKLRDFLVRLLKLDEDQPLPAEADLINQIGLTPSRPSTPSPPCMSCWTR